MPKSPSYRDFLVPVEGAWMDSRIPQIARRLQERDRDLEIRADCGRSGNQVRQYMVFWRNEFIARFAPTEVDLIESEILRLDRTNPGHVETIDRVEASDARRERDASRAFNDVYMEMLEHNARLEAELEFGKTFHGQAGRGESPGHK